MPDMLLVYTKHLQMDDNTGYGKVYRGRLDQVTGVNFQGSVKNLKDLISSIFHIDSQNMEIHFHQEPIQDERSLTDVGLESGSLIFISDKEVLNPQPVIPACTPDSIAKAYTLYKSFIQNKTKKIEWDTIKSILERIPAFRRYASSLSILKDLILIESLRDKETLKKIAETHPILIEEAERIVYIANANLPSTPALRGSQSDESLSDHSSESDSPSNGSRPVITSTHLTRALSLFNQDQLPNQFGASTSSSMVTSPTTASASEPSFATQLTALREMGLNDEARNRRALIITDGDLATAINLIMNNPDLL